MIETSINSFSTQKNVKIIENETEYYSTNIRTSKTKKFILQNTLLFLLLLIIGLYMKYFIFNDIKNKYSKTYFPGFTIILSYNFIFIGMFGICTPFINYIICVMNKDKNIHIVSIYYTIKKLSTQILLFASAQLIALALKKDSFFNEQNNEKEIFFIFKKEDLANFYITISFVIGVFLIKSFITGFLKYIVYTNHAKKRIESVNNKLSIISKILVISNASYSDDIKIIIEKIIQHLGNGNNFLERKNLQNYLSQEDIDSLFFYTDRFDNKTIEPLHFEIFYHSTFYEQEHLASCLMQISETFQKLNLISTIIAIPVIVSVVLNGFDSSSNAATKIGIVATGMLSGGYIFNAIIKNFLDSMLFVFFVRPFEVNDFIKINNVIYKVKEINIFTTLLTTNKLEILFLNHNLLNLAIINFRTSKAIEISYDYTFKTDDFKTNSKKFLTLLENYMNTKNILFKKSPYFKETKIISPEKISTKLICNFNLVKMNMRELIENQEELILVINDIFKHSNLLPFT